MEIIKILRIYWWHYFRNISKECMKTHKNMLWVYNVKVIHIYNLLKYYLLFLHSKYTKNQEKIPYMIFLNMHLTLISDNYTVILTVSLIKQGDLCKCYKIIVKKTQQNQNSSLKNNPINVTRNLHKKYHKNQNI